MNAGAFSYLVNSPPAKRVDPDALHQMAKTAARDYIVGKVPLNTSIAKMAASNELNQEQLARVCEMANIATHQELWGRSSEKEKVAFEVADAKKIIAKKTPSETLAKATKGGLGTDYAGPPKDMPVSGGSLASMIGCDPSSVHHGLTNVPEKKQLMIILSKKAAEYQRARDTAVVQYLAVKNAEKVAFVEVKKAVLQGAIFPDLFKAACAAGYQKTAAEYFPDFQKRLIAESHGRLRLRLEKTAIAQAPEDLISQEMDGVTVANGAHPLLVSLDTLANKNEEARNGLHSLMRIGDEVKLREQRLRELNK